MVQVSSFKREEFERSVLEWGCLHQGTLKGATDVSNTCVSCSYGIRSTTTLGYELSLLALLFH